MNQLEIEFFWPLTQQIPLDLDYRGCDTRPKITTENLIFNGTGINIGSLGTVTQALKLNVDSITFTYTNKEEPPWYRRMLLNIIGFKWEKS